MIHVDYRSTQRESFIYCGVILLLEHNQIFKTKEMRTSFFDYLLNLLIFQTRFSVRNTNFYSVPLYLLGLVANQIYPDLKLKYELTLINEVDDLNSVIDILSNDNNKLSAKSKAKLSKRINIEFNFHKRQLMQKGQTLEIEKLETNIKKLDILL